MKTLNNLLFVLLGICISGFTFCVIVGIAVNTNKAMTDSTLKRTYELGYMKGRIDVVEIYLDHHGVLNSDELDSIQYKSINSFQNLIKTSKYQP